MYFLTGHPDYNAQTYTGYDIVNPEVENIMKLLRPNYRFSMILKIIKLWPHGFHSWHSAKFNRSFGCQFKQSI